MREQRGREAVKAIAFIAGAEAVGGLAEYFLTNRQFNLNTIVAAVTAGATSFTVYAGYRIGKALGH